MQYVAHLQLDILALPKLIQRFLLLLVSMVVSATPVPIAAPVDVAARAPVSVFSLGLLVVSVLTTLGIAGA
jgi:hypothetical protein